MKCGIKEVSELTGVSARTLRYYDQIGLLKPSKTSEAGYRYYGERELEILQQILFYKERGMELKQIKKIIYQKDFDIMAALREHLLELEEKRNHMEALIQTVEQRATTKTARVTAGSPQAPSTSTVWQRFSATTPAISVCRACPTAPIWWWKPPSPRICIRRNRTWWSLTATAR